MENVPKLRNCYILAAALIGTSHHPQDNRTTSRITRAISRNARAMSIRSPPGQGLLIGVVLMVLEVLRVGLEAVLVSQGWGLVFTCQDSLIVR